MIFSKLDVCLSVRQGLTYVYMCLI